MNLSSNQLEMLDKVDSKPKPARYVEIKDSKDGQFFYRVTGANREPVYTSETFPTKAIAKEAARREHEGRTNYDYVLEWYDGRRKSMVRETI